MTGAARVAPRRAPRLGPDDRIASLFTRTGRFAAVDPTKPHRLPAISRVVGSLAWAVFIEETLRRARRASRTAPP